MKTKQQKTAHDKEMAAEYRRINRDIINANQRAMRKIHNGSRVPKKYPSLDSL